TGPPPRGRGRLPPRSRGRSPVGSACRPRAASSASPPRAPLWPARARSGAPRGTPRPGPGARSGRPPARVPRSEKLLLAALAGGLAVELGAQLVRELGAALHEVGGLGRVDLARPQPRRGLLKLARQRLEPVA